MTGTMNMFPDAPRKARIVRMRVVDAGDCGATMRGWRTSTGAHFECHKCGHDDGWTFDMTVSEIRRGLPCPVCNEGRA